MSEQTPSGQLGGLADKLQKPAPQASEATVDHLDEAKQHMACYTIGTTYATNQEQAIVAIAHALIAQAELFAERNALLRENGALLREGVALSKASLAMDEAATSAQRLTWEDLPPHIRYGCRVYQDGDRWCCLLGECIAEDPCAFGPTPAAACAAFDRLWETGSAEEGDD